MMVYPELQRTIKDLDNLQNQISAERKVVLDQIIAHLNQLEDRSEINLQFICTHNSRRSILSQVWAQFLIEHFGLTNFHCFSGGTEATAVYPAVLTTLERQGFRHRLNKQGPNPHYAIYYSDHADPVNGFSKVYNDASNPEHFIAIMTCADAEKNCPYIPQAELRLSLTYEDPKKYDDQPEKEVKYLERSQQIGSELYYIFSKINL